MSHLTPTFPKVKEAGFRLSVIPNTTRSLSPGMTCRNSDDVIIDKSVTLPKLPKVTGSGQRRNSHSLNFSFIRHNKMFIHEKPGQEHLLPGIGTFVIDTPKDKELNARQRSFRYQEAHRGVTRSKLKPFPDIPVPKRFGMKGLPIVQLKDLNGKVVDSATSPFRLATPPEEELGSSTAPSVAGSGSSQSESRCERIRKQPEMTQKVPPSQDELVSRSPLGRMAHGEHDRHRGTPVAVGGFGVRKSKPVINCKMTAPASASATSASPSGLGLGGRREFTNLTTNVSLVEPGPASCKATERELESQAEYRKQLTFYLAQMFDAEKDQHKMVTSNNSTCNNNFTTNGDVSKSGGGGGGSIHVDNVGHTSKHQEWESSISLGEVLLNTGATPNLRKRLNADFKTNGNGSGRQSYNVTPEVMVIAGRYQQPDSKHWSSADNKKYCISKDITSGNGAKGNGNNNNSNKTNNNNTDSNNHKHDNEHTKNKDCLHDYDANPSSNNSNSSKLKPKAVESALPPKRRPSVTLSSGKEFQNTTKRRPSVTLNSEKDSQNTTKRRPSVTLNSGKDSQNTTKRKDENEAGKHNEHGEGDMRVNSIPVSLVGDGVASGEVTRHRDDGCDNNDDDDDDVDDDYDGRDHEHDDDEEGYPDGQCGAMVDEKWLHMVNTTVVDGGMYDRYANVKLPPAMLHPAHNVPATLARSDRPNGKAKRKKDPVCEN